MNRIHAKPIENGNVKTRPSTFVVFKNKTLAMSKAFRKKRISKLLNSRPFNNLIIFLVFFYFGMIIFSFAFEDFEFGNRDAEYLDRMRKVFIQIEIAILFIFQVEILLNMYVYGIRIYFRSCLTIIDAFIITLSICLAFADLYITNSSFSSISRFLRGSTRFFRIFILFRKMQLQKKVRNSRNMNKSALESVLEILQVVKGQVKKRAQIKNLEWAIGVIAENKLYTPLLQDEKFGSAERIQEVNKWIEGYSPTKQARKSSLNKGRRISGVVSDEIIRKSIILDIPVHIIKNFTSVDELEFNSFKLCEISKECSIPNIITYLFHKYDLLSELQIEKEKLFNFGSKIQLKYKNNPYHNFIHAFDTCQTVNFFIGKLEIAKKACLSKLEIASLLIAAAGHDVEHPFDIVHLEG